MRIGVFQSACGGLAIEQRVERLANAIAKQAQTQAVDLVVCPELFLSGYNVGQDLKQKAEPVDGEYFTRIKALTSASGTAIVYGYPEACADKIFNSASCVTSNGIVLANHRKQLNSPGSFEADYFTPGDRATYFDYQGVKIALMICYEVEFPESVRAAAVAGAQLVVVPTALVSQWAVVAERVVPARAFENGVWLAYANHAGHENGFDYLGGSKIVAPNGHIIAEAGATEQLITADIDVQSIVAAQTRLPYLQDYAKYKID